MSFESREQGGAGVEKRGRTNEEVVFCVTKDHEDTLLLEDDFSQSDYVDVM